jgi:transposase
VIAAVEAGATRWAAAAQFKVSVSSAIRWVQRWQRDWAIAAKPRGGSVSPLEDHDEAAKFGLRYVLSPISVIRDSRYPAVFGPGSRF